MKNLVILFTAILLVLLPVVLIIGCQQQPTPAPTTPVPTPTPAPTTPVPTPTPAAPITPKGEDAEFYFKRGAAYYEKGEYDKAIADLSEAIRLNPQYAEAYSDRGGAYSNLGQFERGIQDLDEAIRLNPKLAVAYYNRGTTYRRLGQPERAIQNLDVAIRLNPQYVEAYNNRGGAYCDLGQFERGIQDLDEAIRLNPQYADTYYNRGAAYCVLGQLERAIQDFDEAIRLNPQDAMAYTNRGTAYLDLGQPERAIQDLDEAIRLNPTLALAYGNRALAYTVLGRDAEAQQDVDRAVGLGFDRALLDTEIERLKKLRSKPETLTYTNSKHGFSVEYPKDWTCEEAEGVMYIIVRFAGPSISIEEGKFMINMNISSEELPGFPKITLEDYSKAGEMQQKRGYENYKKVDEHTATIADLPAIVRTYTCDYKGIEHMHTQASFLKENVVYIVGYGATPKSHDQYYDCFETVINSFKFE